jgi:hypothetical protein
MLRSREAAAHRSVSECVVAHVLCAGKTTVSPCTTNGLMPVRTSGGQKIGFDKLDGSVGNVSANMLDRATAEIIDDADRGTALDECIHQVRANEGCTSGDQNPSALHASLMAGRRDVPAQPGIVGTTSVLPVARAARETRGGAGGLSRRRTPRTPHRAAADRGGTRPGLWGH